jgi:hypothetical protein
MILLLTPGFPRRMDGQSAVSRRGDCPKGAPLLDCAHQLGVDLVNLCDGTGSCGHCIVQLMEGYVSEPVRVRALGNAAKSALIGRISPPSRNLLDLVSRAGLEPAAR